MSSKGHQANMSDSRKEEISQVCDPKDTASPVTIQSRLKAITSEFGKQTEGINWVKLTIAMVLVVVLSFGIAYLFQIVAAKLHLPLYDIAWLAYLIVFLFSLAANLTIIAPVPIGMSVLLAAATTWNPLFVAFFASIGASLGELSGYFAGYLGRKVAIPEGQRWYARFESWIQRRGAWAVFFLAIQPILPFDIAGIIAGTAKMSLHKFLPALWAGRFPKYILFAYAGAWLIQHVPFLAQ
jgi:uncharacterized membrane protein YdjX (TVP38/TMEM64 family)